VASPRFCTVTLRDAERGAALESVTVRPSVWLPLATVVVFHENDAVVAAGGRREDLSAVDAEAIGVGRGAAAGGEADGDGAGDGGAGGRAGERRGERGWRRAFCTVTLRDADAEPLWESVTVSPEGVAAVGDGRGVPAERRGSSHWWSWRRPGRRRR
jgi:hypothetical protein